MQEEFEIRLQEEFPFMKRDMSDIPLEERGKIHNIYQAWGCECSKGWYSLINELCQAITERYAEDGISSEGIDLEVLQIKEKFATLRFYYGFNGVSCGLQAIDFLGGPSLRFEPQIDEDDESKKKLRHDISIIVGSYEKKSANVCEYCGKEGKTRMDMSWKKTLCDDCYNAYLRKREEKSNS